MKQLVIVFAAVLAMLMLPLVDAMQGKTRDDEPTPSMACMSTVSPGKCDHFRPKSIQCLGACGSDRDCIVAKMSHGGIDYWTCVCSCSDDPSCKKPDVEPSCCHIVLDLGIKEWTVRGVCQTCPAKNGECTRLLDERKGVCAAVCK